ncbi:hypothetical protein RN001_014016 [Aquatica leii]|uniref:Major facilitator superfamily (MFS) profile domain-containing protein n=1 Tax=Aquatica leii TaxID=1421715 RepID=A0AAN7P590_9COLE|nr:hypothetical protein RN001_014016 [Aquatica leii]
MYISWSSPTIPLLTSPNSPIGVQLTKEEASWIVSAMSLGMMPGSIISGLLIDKIGRKKLMLLAGLLLFIPWFVVMFATSFAMLLSARIVAGVGNGIVTAVMSLYLGEISEKRSRGILTSAPSFGAVLATIITLGIGPFVAFTTLAIVCATAPALFCLTIYFLPESPYYLIKTKQYQAAKLVLKTLLNSEDVDDCLKEIEATVKNDELHKLTLKKILFESNYRKSLLLVIAAKTFQQFSGMFAINPYLQTIMEESQTSLSPEISSVVFAAIQIPCVIISALLMDKLGRRPLLVISSAGCCVSLVGEGVYFYLLKAQTVDLTDVYFLPTLCLTVYYIMIPIGIGNLAYVATGELFQTNFKKIGSTIFAFYSGFLSLVNLKMLNPITEAWGMHAIFWIFAGGTFLGILFGVFVLPETKVLSLNTAQFMYISWSSPTIPLLTSPNSPIGVQLTKEEASWVVSAMSLGMMPGSIISGLLIDKIGRKKLMLLAGLLILVPWLVVMFATSFAMLLSARIVAGVGNGIVAAVAPLYLGEISEKRSRGILTSAPSFGAVLATIIVLGIGPFVAFTTLAIVCATAPALFCLTIYFLPESPYYLIKTKQYQAAKNVLKTLLNSEDVDNWLKEIETTVKNDELHKLTPKKILFESNYRKSLLLAIAAKTLQQFSGMFAINPYLQTIMESSQTSLSPEISSVIFAAIQIPCVIISALLMDKLGRRPLLIISATGCCVSLVGEGVYFYLLKAQTVDLTGVYFLPTLFLAVYYIMIPIGIGNLAYVATGELFQTNFKKIGSSIFAFYSGFLSLVNLKMFNPITETWGMHAIFWIFAGGTFLGILFGVFVLPETKGKSFEEIQDILQKKPGKKPDVINCKY